MKKLIFTLLFIIFIVLVVKNYTSSYEIKYKIDSFIVNINYKNNRYYFEINGKYDFNFKIYSNRKISKKVISSIKEYKNDESYCIYPVIDFFDTYPLCYKADQLIDFSLIKDELSIEEYNSAEKEDKIYYANNNFTFFSNLSDDSYIAVWKYNGFYIMNRNKIKVLDIFEKDNYDNDLCVQINKYLLLPNYDEEHEFKKFLLINIVNGKKYTIETKYEISYDSYIAGTHLNNVYLYDSKSDILYEINIKLRNVKIVGDDTDGYIKIDKGEYKSATRNEYEIDKITYFELNSDDTDFNINEKGVFKYYKENNSLITLISNNLDLKFIESKNDKAYFIDDENLYEYISSLGFYKIFNYFELNFNKDVIYIYNQ